MTLKEKIGQDIKSALRAKENLRLVTLRGLSAALHNKEIEKRSKSAKPEGLTEEESLAVLRFEVKKRRDALAEFAKGGRKDLADKETAELKILETYLPQEFKDEEIEKIVQEAIGQMGEVGEKDFGRVMGEVMRRVKGRASGERVSAVVRKILGK